jgi:hypothetical protein
MTFGKHFNPALASDSAYFHALNDVMKCVEKHADVSTNQQDKVCHREFK